MSKNVETYFFTLFGLKSKDFFFSEGTKRPSFHLLFAFLSVNSLTLDFFLAFFR